MEAKNIPEKFAITHQHTAKNIGNIAYNFPKVGRILPNIGTTFRNKWYTAQTMFIRVATPCELLITGKAK